MVLVAFLAVLVALPGGFLEPTPYQLGGFYDAQARAWFDGRWDAAENAFFIERITLDGRHYMYFGPWPSMLRAPVLAVTDAFDGRLTRVSLVLALLVLLAGASRLLWQVRELREPARGAPSRAEQAVVAAWLVAIGCGTSVLLMSASVWVYDEAILWGAAWATWTVSVGLGHLLRPSARSLVLLSLCTTLAVLSRVSSGAIGIVLLGGVLLVELLRGDRLARIAGLGERFRGRAPWATLGGLSVPVAAHALVNQAKFGSPFEVPFQLQDLVNQASPQRAGVLAANGNDLLAIGEIPTNLFNYLRPDGISFSRLFPFVDFSDGVVLVGSPARDVEWLYASVTITATLVLAVAVLGAATVFVPRLAARASLPGVAVLRLPALATVVGVVPALMFPAAVQRYTVDLLPAFALLGATGLYSVAGWVRDRRTARRVVAVVAVSVLAWNVAVNLALTFNLQRAYQTVGPADERAEYLLERIRWTERLGLEPRLPVVRWDPERDPVPAPGQLGSLLVVGPCTELRQSDGTAWLELAFDDPSAVCASLNA